MTERILKKLKKEYPRKEYERWDYIWSGFVKMEDLLDRLFSLKEEWSKLEGFQEIGVAAEYEGYDITITAKFLETDEEWEKRIIDQYNKVQEYEKTLEQKRNEEERKEYERLKKKFEGTP